MAQPKSEERLDTKAHFSTSRNQLQVTYARHYNPLADGIFETGAYAVPSKSQNSTILGQDGSSSTQCSNPSWALRWRHPFGTNSYPPFRHSTKNQVFSLTLDF